MRTARGCGGAKTTERATGIWRDLIASSAAARGRGGAQMSAAH